MIRADRPHAEGGLPVLKYVEPEEPDYDDWEAVDAYVEMMYPPQEVEICLQAVKLIVAVTQYLQEAAEGR